MRADFEKLTLENNKDWYHDKFGCNNGVSSLLVKVSRRKWVKGQTIGITTANLEAFNNDVCWRIVSRINILEWYPTRWEQTMRKLTAYCEKNITTRRKFNLCESLPKNISLSMKLKHEDLHIEIQVRLKLLQ